MQDEKLAVAVACLTELAQQNKNILEDLQTLMDDFRDGMHSSLTTSRRSQQVVSTAFEEAAVLRERQNEKTVTEETGYKHQGNLFS